MNFSLKLFCFASMLFFVLELNSINSSALAQPPQTGQDVASPRQPVPYQTPVYALPTKPSDAAVKARNLKWIKTQNDFNQSTFADNAAIDTEIERRLKVYDHKTPIISYDVPINYNKLSYKAYQKYSEFNSSIGNLKIANNNGPLDKKAHFWQYGDIYIAVPEDTYKDQLNIYSLIRSIEILKVRYPKAYQRLFVEPMSVSPGNFVSTNDQYKNKNSILLFSFDEAPSDVAVGITAIGPKSPADEYQNVSVVSIHSKNIQGSTATGSKPLYNASKDENYIRYLREGLVETLVHEMLHRYLDFKYTKDKVFYDLYKARYNSAYPEQDRIDSEEVIVNITSINYFNREGGLEPNISTLYTDVFNKMTTKLPKTMLDSYAGMVQAGTTSQLYKDRLLLNILN